MADSAPMPFNKYVPASDKGIPFDSQRGNTGAQGYNINVGSRKTQAVFWVCKA